MLWTGSHDFKAFTGKKGKNQQCVLSIPFRSTVWEEIHFTFSGNGFLYHMVRILMGTLLEVGTGAKKPEDMNAILESGSGRCRASCTGLRAGFDGSSLFLRAVSRTSVRRIG
ncbi:MAG: hypothetical protein ACLUOI_12980 [Eisenbergiella sp.]